MLRLTCTGPHTRNGLQRDLRTNCLQVQLERKRIRNPDGQMHNAGAVLSHHEAAHSWLRSARLNDALY